MPWRLVAQEILPEEIFSKANDPKVMVALHGGWDKNSHVVNMLYAQDIRFKGLPGVAGSMSLQYQIYSWAALRVDAAYLQKNYKMYRQGYLVNGVYTETTNDYLCVPVVAQYSVGKAVRAYGFVGGYMGYWLRSHRQGVTLSMNNIIYDNKEGSEFDEDVQFDAVKDNRVDYGLTYGCGVGFTTKGGLDVSFEVRGLYGLSDMQKPYMEYLVPRYNTTTLFQFGVGYWL